MVAPTNAMTHVVTEPCILCKYTGCVEVCPVDAFRNGKNMLVIDPEKCIDSRLRVPECPVNAIYPDNEVARESAGLLQDQREIFPSLAGHHP